MKNNSKEKLNNTKEIAISVTKVSKTFCIPHEKVTSLRGAAVSLFKSGTTEEFKALDNVSFDVKKGEFFGIIGRNGSGKSTLLKILAGIYQADKGTVKVDGMISPFLELGIGFNPELSGRDNVYLNATVLGMTQKQIDDKFGSIVKFAELERFIDQKLKNYSSGMQVRLAFAVSIHANRDILLMDEVLAVGDSNFQSKCLEEFNKYRDMGRTVIIVTHDTGVVERYCDRAMLLTNGNIIKLDVASVVVDEYVQENIVDEEVRISKDADKEKNKMKKTINKIVEITKITLLNNSGFVKNVFKTGEDISIRVYFKVNKKIDGEINFGTAITNQEGVCIFGTNTFISGIDSQEVLNDGYFQIDYPQNQLGENKYYVTAGIWGESVTHNYDYQLNFASFKIFSNDQNIGIMRLKHNILNKRK